MNVVRDFFQPLGFPFCNTFPDNESSKGDDRIVRLRDFFDSVRSWTYNTNLLAGAVHAEVQALSRMGYTFSCCEHHRDTTENAERAARINMAVSCMALITLLCRANQTTAQLAQQSSVPECATVYGHRFDKLKLSWVKYTLMDSLRDHEANTHTVGPTLHSHQRQALPDDEGAAGLLCCYRKQRPS